MIDFFARWLRALVTNGLIASIICTPLWASTLLILFGIGHPIELWRVIAVAFASVYFILMAWTSFFIMKESADYQGKKLAHEVYVWLL